MYRTFLWLTFFSLLFCIRSEADDLQFKALEAGRGTRGTAGTSFVTYEASDGVRVFQTIEFHSSTAATRRAL